MTVAAGESREQLSGVVVMGLGLLVVVSAVLALTALRSSGIDGEALLQERFEASDLPFDFEVLEAFRLPQGEEVVILGDPALDRDAVELAQRAALSELPVETRPPDGMGGGPKYDWGKLPLGDDLSPPVEMAFVWYPSSRADKLLERQFGMLVFRDLAKVDWDGGTVVVDSGPLDWGDYATSYVRERVFTRDEGRPVFHETARINLTIGTRCCVLYLSWQRGMLGTKQRITEALECVAPLSE